MSLWSSTLLCTSRRLSLRSSRWLSLCGSRLLLCRRCLFLCSCWLSLVVDDLDSVTGLLEDEGLVQVLTVVGLVVCCVEGGNRLRNGG